jgi:hypothetical protein
MAWRKTTRSDDEKEEMKIRLMRRTKVMKHKKMEEGDDNVNNDRITAAVILIVGYKAVLVAVIASISSPLSLQPSSPVLFLWPTLDHAPPAAACVRSRQKTTASRHLLQSNGWLELDHGRFVVTMGRR